MVGARATLRAARAIGQKATVSYRLIDIDWTRRADAQFRPARRAAADAPVPLIASHGIGASRQD